MGGSKLSPRDIAEDLDVSLETVYSWFKNGTGPDRIKVGKHVRVTPEAYRRWLTGRTVTAEGRPA